MEITVGSTCDRELVNAATKVAISYRFQIQFHGFNETLMGCGCQIEHEIQNNIKRKYNTSATHSIRIAFEDTDPTAPVWCKEGKKLANEQIQTSGILFESFRPCQRSKRT